MKWNNYNKNYNTRQSKSRRIPWDSRGQPLELFPSNLFPWIGIWNIIRISSEGILLQVSLRCSGSMWVHMTTYVHFMTQPGPVAKNHLQGFRLRIEPATLGPDLVLKCISFWHSNLPYFKKFHLLTTSVKLLIWLLGDWGFSTGRIKLFRVSQTKILKSALVAGVWFSKQGFNLRVATIFCHYWPQCFIMCFRKCGRIERVKGHRLSTGLS